jgi:hypothetical protein
VSNKPNGALFKTEKDLIKLLVNHFGDGLEKGLIILENY